MLANVFQRSNRRAAYVLHCAGGRSSFKYHKKNVFWLQILLSFSLVLFFPGPAALNGALILTPLSKLLCRHFQRREIALASLIYVKTRFFFLPSSNAKRRYPKPFSQIPTSSCDASRRVVGWVNPYMCVEFELARAPST